MKGDIAIAVYEHISTGNFGKYLKYLEERFLKLLPIDTVDRENCNYDRIHTGKIVTTIATHRENCNYDRYSQEKL